MITVPRIPFIRRRGKAPTIAPPPPVALTLVAAEFSRGVWVRVTFDRPVSIADIDVTAFYLDDYDSDEAWGGTGTATLVSPTQVQVPLMVLHAADEPGTHLTVNADSGIVAVDDGGTWSGVADLGVPFP